MTIICKLIEPNFQYMLNFKKIIKIVSLSSIGFLIILGILFINVNRIDSDSVTKNLVDAVKDHYPIKLEFESFKLKKFPTPYLEFKNLKVGKAIFIDNAKLNFSISSLFFGSPKLKLLSLDNLYINPITSGFENSNYQEIINFITSSNGFLNNLKISTIWDTDLNNIIVAKDLSITKSGKNFTIYSQLRNNIEITQDANFNINSENWDSKIQISNKDFNINVRNNFDKNGTIEGDFDGKIKHLANFTDDISPYINFMFNRNITADSSVDIKGKIQKNGKNLTLKNISLISDIFKANAVYNFTTKDKANTLNIDFKHLNLSSLIGSNEYRKLTDNESIIKLEKSKLKININAKDINFLGESITDFKLISISESDVLNISEANGKLGDSGKFILKGNVSSNEYRSKFDGEMQISHNNLNQFLKKTKYKEYVSNNEAPFYFKARVIATPIDFKMNNFELTVARENIRGNADLKFLGNENIAIANLQFEDVDIKNTNIPFLNSVYEYFLSLGKDMSKNEYNKKFIVLRTMPLKALVNLNFDRLKIGDVFLRRFNSFSTLDSGRLNIEDFLIDSEDLSLKGSARILSSGLRPNFRINFTEGRLDTTKLNKDHWDNIIWYINNHVDLQKINFSSNSFLNSLKFSKADFKNISWQMSTNSGVLSIENTDFVIFDGHGNFAMNMIINPIRFSSAFGLSSINVQSLLNEIGLTNIPFTNGYASINGQSTSNGDNIDSLLRNLYARGKFLAKDIEIKNLDLSTVIDNISYPDIQRKDAEKELEKVFSKGKTKLNESRGNYELDRKVFTVSNTNMLSDYFTGSVGLAINVYDSSIDYKSIISFYPIGARILTPERTRPVQLTLDLNGDFFNPDKNLKFRSPDEISRIRSLLARRVFD